MINVKNSIKSLLIVLVIFISSSFLLSLFHLTDNNKLFLSTLCMLLTYIIILSYFFFFKKNNDSLIKYDKINIKNIILSLFASIFILLINLIIIYLFMPISNTGNQTTKNVTEYVGMFSLYVSFIFPVFIAPLFEELIFRGIIGSIFKIFNNNKNITYILINSFLFSLLHLQITGNSFSIITSMLFPFISGLIFSYIYLKSKNIIYPIITHSFFNLLIILISNN